MGERLHRKANKSERARDIPELNPEGPRSAAAQPGSASHTRSFAPQALKAIHPTNGTSWEQSPATAKEEQTPFPVLQQQRCSGEAQLYSPSWGTDFPLLLKLQRRFTDLI